MTDAEEEMKLYDKIRDAERGHIAFLGFCFIFAIIPCLFPVFLDSLFARTKLTEYSNMITAAFPVMAIIIAKVHCKNHKKTRETLRKEKTQLENNIMTTQEKQKTND